MTTLVMLILVPLVGQAESIEPNQPEVFEKVRQDIAPLTHPLGDRLPILTWQSRGFPTGLEDGRVGEVQQLVTKEVSPLRSLQRDNQIIR